MSHSLNSLNGGYVGEYIGTTIGVIKGDTRSLDYSSYGVGCVRMDLCGGFRKFWMVFLGSVP